CSADEKMCRGLVTAFTREAGSWVARARADLTERYDVHDETWLSGLTVSHSMGRFGQLGLRDLRLVSQSDGSPYLRDGRLLLTATSAGPGGFTTGHCSVWSLDPETLELEHRADLFVRRGVDHGVYGDHAAHLLRDGDRWLLAASTWGDFDPHRRPVGVVLAETTDDVTRGVHVLDGRPFALPTDGFRSVGVWDPHLVRSGSGWLVGYVSATKYFRFHPVLAAGPDLDSLVLRAVAEGHRETEGTTLTRLTGPDGEWRVLASDKRRRCYPVLDLDLREVDRLDAFYPTNIPWPTIATLDSESLLVGFNGAPYGGRLVGYGSHGEVVLQRASGD
ncbi:MAG TPA: hypothetical protein PLZ93_18245, partial [Nocardioides sp.]|nr:hypothetical protein [Nocardioides sp.]